VEGIRNWQCRVENVKFSIHKQKGYNVELFRAASKTEKRQDAAFLLFLLSAADARTASANVRLNNLCYNPSTMSIEKNKPPPDCQLRTPSTVPIEKRPPGIKSAEQLE